MRWQTDLQRKEAKWTKWIRRSHSMRPEPSSKRSSPRNGCRTIHAYSPSDSYHLLRRREQVTVFRLRTGHSRLRHHLHTKLGIGPNVECPCNTGHYDSGPYPPNMPELQRHASKDMANRRNPACRQSSTAAQRIFGKLLPSSKRLVWTSE